MSNIAKGITEEGWRVDAATGNRRPSDLNVGDHSFTWGYLWRSIEMEFINE